VTDAPAPKNLRPWWLEDAEPPIQRARAKVAEGAAPLDIKGDCQAFIAVTPPGDPALAEYFMAIVRGNRNFIKAVADGEDPKATRAERGLTSLAQWDRDPESDSTPEAATVTANTVGLMKIPPGEEFTASWTAVIQGVQELLAAARDPAIADEELTPRDEAIAASVRALGAQLAAVTDRLRSANAALATSLAAGKPAPAEPVTEEAVAAEGGESAEAAAPPAPAEETAPAPAG
jgi:hypothetical protein